MQLLKNASSSFGKGPHGTNGFELVIVPDAVIIGAGF